MYRILLPYADEADPSGRFRFFLVLARWTGRRISTIRRFRRATLLFTIDEIRAALERQLCRYVYEEDFGRVAKLYAESGGPLYIEYWMEKSGQTGDENRVEQYDAVVPIHPVVAAEAEHYLTRYWDKGNLSPSDPLFPGGRAKNKPSSRRPVSKETINEWLNRAITLAALGGHIVSLLPDNKWHGFRYNRRTELRKVEVKYARWLVGHSVHNGTPGITVSEGRYLELVPEDLVAGALIEPAEVEPEAKEE